MIKTSLKLITALSAFLTMEGYAQLWLDMDNGFGCQAFGVKEISLDASGEHIVSRGDFTSLNSCVEMRNTSVWSGSAWQNMGCSDGIGQGGGLAVYQNALYSTGFSSCVDNVVASYLYGWDGLSWSSFWISDESSSAYDMIVHDEKLYVSGAIFEIQGEPYTTLFSFDGNIVVPLISESSFYTGDSSFGNALAVYHDTLFVGGKFKGADLQGRTDNFASVYDETIHKVSVGLENSSSIVEALCVHRDTLFIGGLFYPDVELQLEDTSALLFYDGHSLKSYGINSTNRITALKSYNDELYIGGWFNALNDTPCIGVAKLNGHQLTPLNTEPFYSPGMEIVSPTIRDLEILHDTLYIGGSFLSIGNATTHGGIAKLNMNLNLDFPEINDQVSISVYPNPASSTLMLKGINRDETFVQITDASGRMLYDAVYSNQLDVSSFASGMYFLKVSNGHRCSVLSFVKE